MSDSQQQFVNQAAYARHRDVSRATVTEYKQKGYLVMDGDLVDVEASDARLSIYLDNRGGSRSPAVKPSAEQERLARAKVEGEEIKVARQRIRMEKEAGLTCEKEKVYMSAFTMARESQEKVLSIADRLAPLLAAESDSGKVYDLLMKELRLVCNSIGKAETEFLDGAKQ